MVTQDLTKIHAAHSQDQESEDRIHWSKYSVMAEAIAPLALYQARGDIVAGLAQSGGAQYLIADTPLLDEEVSAIKLVKLCLADLVLCRVYTDAANTWSPIQDQAIRLSPRARRRRRRAYDSSG